MEFTFKQLDEQDFAFNYIVEGERLAQITWRLQGNIMSVTHTYVSERLRGQGIAKRLLDTAADYAREHHYEMRAICSYVVDAFQRTTDYDDVKIN